MILSQNGNIVSITPVGLYKGKDIMIAIDSSKTNTAMTIGDMAGNVIDYWEFDGSQDKDVLSLCYLQRKELSSILSGANIKYCGIEDIITKKENGGLQMHMSRFKITAVFMSFIFYFQEMFNMTPELINNQAWKSAILPAEFRHRDVGKGSLAYFKSIHSPLGNCKDDVTDSVCIYLYMCKVHNIEKGIRVDTEENLKRTCKWVITPMNHPVQPTAVKFIYNSELPFKFNFNFVANRLNKGTKLGYIEVPTECVPLKDIYAYCDKSLKFEKECDKLRIYVLGIS